MQFVPAMPEPSVPQDSLHVAVAAQVTMQSPSHLMSQLDVSLQVTAPPVPRSSLHSALFTHVAELRAPAFSSHFEDALQLMLLPSPALPLHSELSWQVMVAGPEDVALHFAAVSQEREHPAASQTVLQSVPAVHRHAFPTAQLQPAPVQLADAGALSDPQFVTSTPWRTITKRVQSRRMRPPLGTRITAVLLRAGSETRVPPRYRVPEASIVTYPRGKFQGRLRAGHRDDQSRTSTRKVPAYRSDVSAIAVLTGHALAQRLEPR
jgi:hypothetical protein